MRSINTAIHSVTAFAPASCANVAVGFDILGFALDNVGDHVTLTKRDDHNIVVECINSHEDIPLACDKNTAAVAVKKLCQDLQLETGFSIHIKKGIPVSSGMGGSAASAVAALVACNAFLHSPLSNKELIPYALLGEEVASGQPHTDNIVPCLLGGFTLTHSSNPIKIIQLPIPKIYCALIHPHLSVPTKLARKILQETVQLNDHIKQSANLAAFIVALYTNDTALLQQSLNDVLIEHQRAQFVPGFYKIKAAAMNAGSIGISFSGSGPSVFAFAKNQQEAAIICEAVQSQLQSDGIDSDRWISAISQKPAHVIKREENSL